MLQTKDINALFCLQQSGAREVIVRPGDEASDGKAYLGYDSRRSQFVTIDIFSGELPKSKIPVIEQRIEMASQIVSPQLPLILDYGKTAVGEIYVVSEFIEGEPLFNYLQRDKDLPANLLAGIILQICDALNAIKHFPKLLASIDLSDFWVCLDRGRMLSVRLGHYGLGRDDSTIGDFALIEKWIRAIVELHLAKSKEGDISNPSAYQELLAECDKQLLFLADLPKLKIAVLRSLGLSTDIAVRFPSSMRSIQRSRQVPSGLMFQLMTRENHLGQMLNERFQPNSDHRVTEFSPFSLHVAKPAEDPTQPSEPVSIYLIPPERLFEENIIEPVHRKMFDPYLKSHSAGFRIRALSCETHFTYLTTSCYEGFPLPCLQASRALLRGRDALEIMRRLHETLRHFESAGFELGLLNPWQLQICFAESSGIDAVALMNEAPFAEWPDWSIRIRVEKPAETFVESTLSTWRYLLRRMDDKDIAALVVWMLEQERFEWALSNGIQIADKEPLSWNPRLDALFISAQKYLDCRNTDQRAKFLDYFDEARDRSSQMSTEGATLRHEQSLLTSPNLG